MAAPTTNAFEELLEALKVRELAEEEQEALLLELNELIAQSTLVRLLEHMDDATQSEFSTLLDGGASEAEAEAFIAQKVPNADAILEEVIRNLTRDVLAGGE